MAEKKSGFVAIVGQPNVGKSTLLNCLVGEKLAGVSPKPQTTRGVIRGILTRPEGQVVYLDTPGVHKPKDLLGDWMGRQVQGSLESADLLYWMVLPGRVDTSDQRILGMLKDIQIPVFLLVSQVDRYPKQDILPVIDYFSKAYPFKEIIPMSSVKRTQIDLLLEKTFEYLPEGPAHFPDDQISDQNERDIVAEIIREQIYHRTKEEVPYGTAVLIDEFLDREDGIAEIHATLVVERDSQKAIVIGKQGQTLKDIGMKARLAIESFLGRKVFLKLWVKVVPDWKKDDSSLRRLGYK